MRGNCLPFDWWGPWEWLPVSTQDRGGFSCWVGGLVRAVDGMGHEVLEFDELQGADVSRGQDDRRGDTGGEGLLPAGSAQAPLITGLEAGEIHFGSGRGKVVAVGPGEGQKFAGDFGADDVDAVVAGAGPTATITEEAGPGG